LKIRNGFVSNSSSSSFIIGYGVVTNETRLRKLFDKNGVQLDSYDVYLLKSGVDNNGSKQEANIISGGNNTSIDIPLNLLNRENLLIVSIQNNEGDYAFSHYLDDDFELDYSPAFAVNFYNKQQQFLINLFSDKTVIKNGLVKFGAERNG